MILLVLTKHWNIIHFLCDVDGLSRAKEPANFLAAPAQAPDFFPSGFGSKEPKTPGSGSDTGSPALDIKITFWMFSIYCLLPFTSSHTFPIKVEIWNKQSKNQICVVAFIQQLYKHKRKKYNNFFAVFFYAWTLISVAWCSVDVSIFGNIRNTVSELA